MNSGRSWPLRWAALSTASALFASCRPRAGAAGSTSSNWRKPHHQNNTAEWFLLYCMLLRCVGILNAAFLLWRLFFPNFISIVSLITLSSVACNRILVRYFAVGMNRNICMHYVHSLDKGRASSITKRGHQNSIWQLATVAISSSRLPPALAILCIRASRLRAVILADDFGLYNAIGQQELSISSIEIGRYAHFA